MGPGISGASKDSELVNNYTHTSPGQRPHIVHPIPMGSPLRSLTDTTVGQSLVRQLLGAPRRKSPIWPAWPYSLPSESQGRGNV